MKSLSYRLWTALVLTVLLASCGSTPPNNYYVLSARDGRTPTQQSPSLGIGPIEIPEYVNRNGLVYNREGNRLHIANYERWAEPVANGVERVISLNLAVILNTENVRAFPWRRAEEPDYGVQLTIITLYADANRATLIAEWQVNKPGSKELLVRRISRLSHDMPSGEVRAEQVPPAYSELLYQLSEIIAASISEDFSSSQAP